MSGMSRFQPKIRGLYEWFCTVVLALVGLWLLFTAIFVAFPIICFVTSGCNIWGSTW